jgi:hypothetical protein
LGCTPGDCASSEKNIAFGVLDNDVTMTPL